MRQIRIRLSEGESIVRLYATKGRRYYMALIEGERGFRVAEYTGGSSFRSDANLYDVRSDVEGRIELARRIDGINYLPIETSCAIVE